MGVEMTFKVRAMQAADNMWVVAALNALIFAAEIVALLVANPLPFMQPGSLPYWAFAQAALNVAIKFLSKWGE